MKMKFATGLVLIFLSITNADAQFTALTAELDTVFFGANTPTPDDPLDPEGLLEFYGTYKVYANFTNPGDALSAIYTDVDALGNPPLYIDAPCGCHNPVAGSSIMDASNPSGIWTGPFLDWEYDTYWTIGMESSDDVGFLPQSVGFPINGENVCSDVINNGTIFNVGMPQNAVAGSDLKILIAQVTTCGDWSVSACFQVFINGEQADIQYNCPGVLEVTHLFNDGECVNDADDDGVCDEFEIIGCMEDAACNFDPAATDNTGGCDYTCYGCTDDGSCNYNPNSTLDDGTCEYLSCAGCIDSGACNFNPDATLSDSSCEYTSCAGCIDPESCNFEPEAILSDGSCEYITCAGCIDIDACNYASEATISTDDCIYPGDNCDDGDASTNFDFIQDDCSCNGFGCNDSEACNYNPNAIPDNAECNYITLYAISGETNPNAIMMLAYTYPSTTGSTYFWESSNGDIEDGEGTPAVHVVWWGDGEGSLCVTETNSGGCSGEQVCLYVDITPVGVSDMQIDLFNVYPTPASEIINITTLTPGSSNLKIRDTAGRVVYSTDIETEASIDVSVFARGTYLIQLVYGENQSSFKRIVLH